ncbi:hypothetical protein RJT34_09701 [Clitoria ternatea]|uniref:Uncharacterized protein n=1 Tax=Clitoria ternatea TaxID=43366 RepID=A0AAN9K7L4_CLITE
MKEVTREFAIMLEKNKGHLLLYPSYVLDLSFSPRFPSNKQPKETDYNALVRKLVRKFHGLTVVHSKVMVLFVRLCF